MRRQFKTNQWRWYTVVFFLGCVCTAQPSSDEREGTTGSFKEEIDLSLDNFDDYD
jgi:hypothetical protein